MTLDTFFEKFDLFADAPVAVAKMRGLILRLAMQGKLSESHKTDGPVSELLREVVKDQMRLGLESSARATSGNSDFSDDETADVIPARWTWVRFGNIARHNAGKTLDKGRNRGELRDYITTSNLYWGFLQLESVRQMPMLDDELERCTAIKGDLLICEGGEAGRAAVWPHDSEISFQNHVHRARFFAGINPYFVQRYLEKLNATGEIEKYRKGVGISNMSGKALASIPIPLPPLAEQKRIVAKVDELMALCDRLEAQQQERETRHAALARASLARFAVAPTPANLNLIFHSSYSIPPADLRKSILTLAVQGKLVPQNPNDETAEDVLARIAETKLRLQKTGQIGKEKPVEPLQPESLPFEPPESWRWAKLAELTELITKGSSPKWQGIAYVSESEGILFITSENVGNYVLRKLDDLKYVSKRFNEIEPRSILKRGDILMNLVGASIGRTAVYDLHDGANINQAVALIRLVRETDGVCPRFLLHYLNSPSAIDYMLSSRVVNAQPNISLTDVREFAVPLPPLAEQRRIVAKVEQLMALVDALETQLAASRATAANLLSALVAELTGTRHTGKVSVPATTTTGRGRPRKSA